MTPLTSNPCTACAGSGWVCENHPDHTFPDPECPCGGAGMPCAICNRPSDGSMPRPITGSRVVWTAEYGYAN